MKLYAKTSEIDTIVNKLLTTSQLNVKNITASGSVDAADGIFDVGSFGSCSIYTQVNLPSIVYFAGYRFHIGTIKCNNGTFDAMVKV